MVETINQDIRSEAVQALASLGYSLSEATKAVGKVGITDDTTVEQLLKDALKKII